MPFLLPLIAYGAKSYMDVLKEKEIAKQQRELLEKQRQVLELQKQLQPAVTEKKTNLLPILIIGALLLFGSEK